jgi:hypothetical protein
MNTATLTPQRELAAYIAAEEQTLAAYRSDMQDQLDAIPASLADRIAAAERGNPAKREQRIRDAAIWADNARVAILQAIEAKEAQHVVTTRSVEIGQLEALRGGVVVMETVDIDTPVMKDGSPVWRDGRIKTRREKVDRPRVLTRDGLVTLATAHLKADGEPRMSPAGKPMVALFTRNQLAALERYRTLYDECREFSIPAIDATEAGGDRTPFNVKRSMTLERMVQNAIAMKPDDEKGRSMQKLEGHVSRLAGRQALNVLRQVAGEGNTIASIASTNRRLAIRLTRALLDAADVLADRFGLQ